MFRFVTFLCYFQHQFFVCFQFSSCTSEYPVFFSSLLHIIIIISVLQNDSTLFFSFINNLPACPSFYRFTINSFQFWHLYKTFHILLYFCECSYLIFFPPCIFCQPFKTPFHFSSSLPPANLTFHHKPLHFFTVIGLRVILCQLAWPDLAAHDGGGGGG